MAGESPRRVVAPTLAHGGRGWLQPLHGQGSLAFTPSRFYRGATSRPWTAGLFLIRMAVCPPGVEFPRLFSEWLLLMHCLLAPGGAGAWPLGADKLTQERLCVRTLSRAQTQQDSAPAASLGEAMLSAQEEQRQGPSPLLPRLQQETGQA